MNRLVPQLLTLLVCLSGVFTLPEAVVVVGWPDSVAAVGTVRETAEGIHEVVDKDSPPTHFHYSLWVFWQDTDVLVVRVLTDVVSAVFKKCPSLYFSVSQS